MILYARDNLVCINVFEQHGEFSVPVLDLAGLSEMVSSEEFHMEKNKYRNLDMFDVKIVVTGRSMHLSGPCNMWKAQ